MHWSIYYVRSLQVKEVSWVGGDCPKILYLYKDDVARTKKKKCYSHQKSETVNFHVKNFIQMKGFDFQDRNLFLFLAPFIHYPDWGQGSARPDLEHRDLNFNDATETENV